MNNPKHKIFDKIIKQIILRKVLNKAFVIWVNWIDWSGKTEFSNQLSNYLISKWYKTQIIHLDCFLNEKSIRYAWDIPEYEKFFYQSYNLNQILDELLIPISKWELINKTFDLLNVHTDKFELKTDFKIDSDTIVIFEWVFLFRNEFVEHLNYKIFLELSFDTQLNRAKIRDVPVFWEQILNKYQNKYIPAQKIYFAKFKPKEIANMIIDNEDFDNPKII